ncbi:DUF4038 domain-containing protein [Singulisphaera sp. PoT]|uniref:apiosidase-like domain-containing protein n=1 Tax=Singulisphaera sp. PoT TaxID=3411797 RepID=UPI003BF4D764
MGTRRIWTTLGGLSAWGVLALFGPPAIGAETPSAEANRVIELYFNGQKAYADPFNGLDVDVTFTTPSKKTHRVPAFWAGGSIWKVRYSSPEVGTHTFETASTDDGDPGLHRQKGKVEVRPYTGTNPLIMHGPLKVADDHRHLAYQDGTPFFWLGDTWWMGLCERLKFPDEFGMLAADRVKKGFNVVQIVAGLYPDMPAFDPRGKNEAGYPWEPEYTRIRPEYFDKADERLSYLVDQGIVPCIVMAWGYHQPFLGTEKMKKHVRYVMARYGALPVVWCMAGEVNLPYYLEKGFPLGGEKQNEAWKGIIQYGKTLNGLDRLITVHPTGLEPLSGRLLYREQDLIDFDMLQTGHGFQEVLTPTIKALRASRAAKPAMPVLNSEVCYENLLGKIPAEIPRLMFWTNMLEGAAGHTYGANGIWQLNRRDQEYGKSPHGGNYGTMPWDESMNLPGSKQLGLGKALLTSLPWTKFEPHPEWAAWAKDKDGASTWGDWIWYPEGNPAQHAPEESRFFRKSFDIPAGGVLRARLKATADDQLSVYLNGELLGTAAGWNKGREFLALEGMLKPGKNVIAVRADNGVGGPKNANPAGLSCRLDYELEDGKKAAVSTDSAWLSTQREQPDWTTLDYNDSAWKPATVVAKFGEGPWGSKIGSEDAYFVPYSAGTDDVRVIYVPAPRPITLEKLGAKAGFNASYFNPVTGKTVDGGKLESDGDGKVNVASPRGWREDWVLILKPAR